jgi:RsiW-degrading membrane proteinase PrsW (M82 family)
MEDLTGIALSIFFGFVPMFLFALLIYWIDRYEKEPKLLLGLVFLWGAVVAAGGAFIVNTLFGLGVYMFTGSEAATELGTGTFIAPFFEEALKGLGVFIVFIFFRSEFDSILDGIVYAAVCALGFAATENAYYIFTYGYMENGLAGIAGLVFVRVILVGWQHPFYTAFTGIGLAASRLSRSAWIKVIAPVTGLFVAMFLHSAHNTLATLLGGGAGFIITTLFDWSGWFAMFLFILWATYREQHRLVQYLQEEVALGVISPSQYKTACSAWAQLAARLSGLASRRYAKTSRFYQLTGELAHKKHQLSTLGEEGGNTAAVQKLRQELVGLKAEAVS